MEQQYFEETVMQNNSFGEDKFRRETSKYVPDADGGPSNGFDCNICLESVQDPVVTLCGHLFCWPCIYKWLHYQNVSAEERCQQLCPVCKAEVSHTTLVPLYGRFQTTSPSKAKASHCGLVIPRRPLGPACGAEPTTSMSPELQHHNYSRQPHAYYPQTEDYLTSSMLNLSSISPNFFHPTIAMFSEAIYARTFGNAITNLYACPNSYGHVGSSSGRLRRHMMKADESLSRICFFFFCCLILCLLLF